MAYPNGVVAEYTYYADNRLHTLANKLGNTLLSTFNYAYDGNGNMLTKLEIKGATAYVYDVLGRLEQVTEPDGKETAYTFDATGNRLTETVTVDNSVTTTAYNYSEHGRLLSAVESSDEAEKTTSFQYDNNGNEISRLVSTISDGNASPGYVLSQPGASTEDEITFEISGYNAFGRLVSVNNDKYKARYTYNADGLRASKTVTEDGVTSTTMFLYNSGYIVLELDGAGEQAAFNVFGCNSIISRETMQGIDYYLYNGRGDVVQLTNSVGNVTATYDYDAFGNLLTITNHPNPFRYCGEYWDYETKRYYFRARYYSPKTGRFTQRDKFRGFYNDPLSLNRFTYAHNNPVKYIDPSGYLSVEVTLPDGKTVTANVTNGVTTMPDGSRPPPGAIVQYPDGRAFQIDAATGKGVAVNTVQVTTTSGTQTATVSNGVTTMADGSRPENGSIVQFPDGRTFQMDATLGKGTQTTVVPVITPDGSITIGGLSNGVTTMLDGSRPPGGSIVVTQSGAAYEMNVELGRGELIHTCGNASLPGNILKSTSTLDFVSFNGYDFEKSIADDNAINWNMIRVLAEVMKENRITNVEVLNAKDIIYTNNGFYLKDEWNSLGSDAQPLFRIGDIGTVIDVRTGKQYEIQIYASSGYGGATHVDYIPVSGFVKDSTFYETIDRGSGWNWGTLPVLVTIGDRTFVASTHGFPHSVNGGDLNTSSGHVCFHFQDTVTINTGYQADHRRAFSEGLSALKMWIGGINTAVMRAAEDKPSCRIKEVYIILELHRLVRIVRMLILS